MAFGSISSPRPLLHSVLGLLMLVAPARGSSEELWQQAQAALRSGKYEAAEGLYRQVLQGNESFAEGWANLGIALHMQKKKPEAIQAFGRALTLKPSLTHPYLFLGIDLFNSGKAAEAQRNLEKYVKLGPADPQGHYYLSLALSTRGQTTAAMQELETAAKLAPRDVDILYHLAQNYIHQANAIVVRVAEQHPSLTLLKEWETSHKGGLIEVLRDSTSTAEHRRKLDALQPQLNRQPLNLEAEQQAAVLLAELFLATVQRFYAIDPGSFRIQQLLAAYYERTSQRAKAIQTLKEILEKNAGVRGIHLALGSIYKDQSQPELALEQLQAELSVASPDPAVHLQLAQVYLMLEQPENALRSLKQYSETSPDDPVLFRTLGKTYLALGKFEDSVSSYERVIAMGNADRALYYQLAQVYRRMGKTDLAARAFEASKKAAARQ